MSTSAGTRGRRRKRSVCRPEIGVHVGARDLDTLVGGPVGLGGGGCDFGSLHTRGVDLEVRLALTADCQDDPEPLRRRGKNGRVRLTLFHRRDLVTILLPKPLDQAEKISAPLIRNHCRHYAASSQITTSGCCVAVSPLDFGLNGINCRIQHFVRILRRFLHIHGRRIFLPSHNSTPNKQYTRQNKERNLPHRSLHRYSTHFISLRSPATIWAIFSADTASLFGVKYWEWARSRGSRLRAARLLVTSGPGITTACLSSASRRTPALPTASWSRVGRWEGARRPTERPGAETGTGTAVGAYTWAALLLRPCGGGSGWPGR